MIFFQSMQFNNIPDKLNEQTIPKKVDNKQACHSKWNETGRSRAAAEYLDYYSHSNSAETQPTLSQWPKAHLNFTWTETSTISGHLSTNIKRREVIKDVLQSLFNTLSVTGSNFKLRWLSLGKESLFIRSWL